LKPTKYEVTALSELKVYQYLQLPLSIIKY